MFRQVIKKDHFTLKCILEVIRPGFGESGGEACVLNIGAQGYFIA